MLKCLKCPTLLRNHSHLVLNYHISTLDHPSLKFISLQVGLRFAPYPLHCLLVNFYMALT